MKNVALIGAGRMGQIHLATLLSLPDIALKYVYDPAPNTSTDIFGASGARFVDDVSVIFDDRDIHACIIATPSTQHVDLLTKCARYGKHAFCEKPVSFNVDELKALKGVVSDAGIRVQIGFNRRFDPSFLELRKAVSNNAVGTLHLIKIINRDPSRPRLDFVKDSGGLFFDFNVHDFDMLRFITNDDVVEIYAVGDALIDPKLKSYHDIDTAIITAKMASGALAIIDASRETGYGYDQQLEVLGERGMLHVKNQSPTQVSLRSHLGLLGDCIHNSFVERYRESYRLELENFFSAEENASLSPNIDDALRAVTIARAAMTSLKEGRPILVLE